MGRDWNLVARAGNRNRRGHGTLGLGLLRASGIEVDVALDAPAAIELVNAGRYDVAVVDIILPGPSGVEVIRRLKSCSPTTRIIACTAYNNCDLVKEAQAVGVSRTIHKPADPALLVTLVKNLAGPSVN